MKLLLSLIVLAGCSSAPSSSPTKAGAIAAMMEKFYGEYDPETKKSTLKEGSKAIERYQKMRGAGLYVLPGDEISCEVKQWVEFSKDSGIVISACNNSIGGDCPTCAPVMGAGVVKKTGAHWTVVHGTDFMEASGSHGKLAEPTLVKLGKESWALQFDVPLEDGDRLSINRRLFSTEPGFNKILEIPVSGSNAANCGNKVGIPCYKFSSTMNPDVNATGLGDIRFSFQGAEPIQSNPKLIKDANLVKKYCYESGYYVRPCSN